MSDPTTAIVFLLAGLVAGFGFGLLYSLRSLIGERKATFGRRRTQVLRIRRNYRSRQRRRLRIAEVN